MTTSSGFAVHRADQTAWRSDIPIALVCGTITGQKALRRNGISRDVPVYSRVEAATAAPPDDDDDERTYRRQRTPNCLRGAGGWSAGQAFR